MRKIAIGKNVLEREWQQVLKESILPANWKPIVSWNMMWTKRII
jgi:hypothetical protein